MKKPINVVKRIREYNKEIDELTRRIENKNNWWPEDRIVEFKKKRWKTKKEKEQYIHKYVHLLL